MLPRQMPVLVLVFLLTLSSVLAVFGFVGSFLPHDGSLPAPVQPSPAVLIGAGDISVCGSQGDNQTADIIDRLLRLYPSAEIFTAGDNAQSMGTMDEFTNCFDPSWGWFKRRIHPSPGNHDWYNNEGEGYFAYFGSAAAPDGKKGGYYSYNLGGWHIVSLNSNCSAVDCQEEAPQARWLKADLERSKDTRCTLLYWHHPVWDSGTVPIMPSVKTLWNIASDYGADVVVNGHDHHYERFAPLDRDGKIDPAGTRPFIVGTGGAWLFDLGQPLPATEVRDNNTFGVIVFTLYPESYTWEFIPVDGGTFTDSGSGDCH